VKADKVTGVVVTIRTGLAKGGKRSHDQRGIDLLEVVVAKSQPFHLAGWVVLYQDIGSLYQSPEDLRPASAADVQGHSQLVGIEIEERAASLRVRDVVGERAATPCPVSARLLDLGHLSSQVSEQLTAVGARNAFGPFDYVQVGKRSRAHFSL
jgi:hypothetical protein